MNAEGAAAPTVRQQTLVREALPVIERAAKDVARRFGHGTSPRELYAVGMFALYRVAAEFEDKVSHDFNDHAYRRARTAMREALRVETRHARRVRAAYDGADMFLAYLRDDTYNVLEHDEEESRRRLEESADALLAATFAALAAEQQRLDVEDPAAAEAEHRDAYEALAQAMQRIPAWAERLLRLLFFERQTLVEAAVTLSVSYATVRRHRDEALAFLRDELHKLGVDRVPPLRDGPANDGDDVWPYAEGGEP